MASPIHRGSSANGSVAEPLNHFKPNSLQKKALKLAKDFKLSESGSTDRKYLKTQVDEIKDVRNCLQLGIYASNTDWDIQTRMKMSSCLRAIEEHLFAVESAWVRLDLQEGITEPKILGETAHANGAFLLSYQDGEEEVPVGVYKPSILAEPGLRKGVDSKDQPYRERAAYIVASYFNEALEQSYDCFDYGPFRVPVTTIEDFVHASFGWKHTMGSFQRFIPKAYDLDTVLLPKNRTSFEQIPLHDWIKLFIFDVSVLSLDSHHGNELVAKVSDNKIGLYIIDNGLCMPSIHGVKETTMEWANFEFVSNKLPQAWKNFLRNLDRFEMQRRIQQDLAAYQHRFQCADKKWRSHSWKMDETVYVLMRSSMKCLQTMADADITINDYMHSVLQRTQKFFIFKTAEGTQVVKAPAMLSKREGMKINLMEQYQILDVKDIELVELEVGQHFQQQLLSDYVESQTSQSEFVSPVKAKTPPSEYQVVKDGVENVSPGLVKRLFEDAL